MGCFAFWHACAQSAAGLLGGELALKGGVINLYSGAETEPATVVRLDQVRKDYETKGFFRIGILPIGVMDGVTFELHHPESVTNSLAQLHQWLGPRAAKSLELRRVKFVVSAPVTNRLETGRAQLAADGRLALFDGVTSCPGRIKCGLRAACSRFPARRPDCSSWKLRHPGLTVCSVIWKPSTHLIRLTYNESTNHHHHCIPACARPTASCSNVPGCG